MLNIEATKRRLLSTRKRLLICNLSIWGYFISGGSACLIASGLIVLVLAGLPLVSNNFIWLGSVGLALLEIGSGLSERALYDQQATELMDVEL